MQSKVFSRLKATKFYLIVNRVGMQKCNLVKSMFLKIDVLTFFLFQKEGKGN